MLEQILQEIKNYFIREVWVGTFEITSGELDVDFLQEGQYFKIHGSTLNDGVYQYPATELKDEKFKGEVWAMAVPPAVIALADEISEWTSANAEMLSSPFLSESFGGYSYTKGSHTVGSGGSAPNSWREQFASQINVWRKARYESIIKRNDYMRNVE